MAGRGGRARSGVKEGRERLERKRRAWRRGGMVSMGGGGVGRGGGEGRK